MLQISAAPTLMSGSFRHGGLALTAGRWSEVDADDPKVREVLLAYTPSHIKLGPSPELGRFGLELGPGGTLIDRRALDAQVALAAETKKKSKT